MKEAIGTVNTSYEVDCLHCGETSYSDVSISDGWEDLEYGDGLPSGVLNCGECRKDF